MLVYTHFDAFPCWFQIWAKYLTIMNFFENFLIICTQFNCKCKEKEFAPVFNSLRSQCKLFYFDMRPIRTLTMFTMHAMVYKDLPVKFVPIYFSIECGHRMSGLSEYSWFYRLLPVQCETIIEALFGFNRSQLLVMYNIKTGWVWKWKRYKIVAACGDFFLEIFFQTCKLQHV